MIRYISQLFKEAGVFRYFFRISIVSNLRTPIEVSLASNGDTFLCIESFFMTSQRICRENNFFSQHLRNAIVNKETKIKV